MKVKTFSIISYDDNHAYGITEDGEDITINLTRLSPELLW